MLYSLGNEALCGAGWAPRSNLDAMEKRKFSALAGNPTPIPMYSISDSLYWWKTKVFNMWC